ncbi:MAG: hypothetical protein ACFCVG_05330 [Kineosporiaceae bacterium]
MAGDAKGWERQRPAPVMRSAVEVAETSRAVAGLCRARDPRLRVLGTGAADAWRWVLGELEPRPLLGDEVLNPSVLDIQDVLGMAAVKVGGLRFPGELPATDVTRIYAHGVATALAWWLARGAGDRPAWAHPDQDEAVTVRRCLGAVGADLGVAGWAVSGAAFPGEAIRA